jgi:muconolactone delta-isomerase
VSQTFPARPSSIPDIRDFVRRWLTKTATVRMVKFLVSREAAAAVARMPAYAKPLERSGKVIGRYHLVGAHGGAWLFDVESNEELERLLGLMPVYNLAHYTVHALADMNDPPDLD